MTRTAGRAAAALALLGVLSPRPAATGEADVTAVDSRCDAARVCRFFVTVRHADTGWDHYADAWEILAPDGSVLGTRVLRHPHVDEQPFTRDLPDVRIPENVRDVTVRARDSVHGLGGKTRTLRLPEDGS